MFLKLLDHTSKANIHHEANAFSNSRLIASERDGFGFGWRSIQATSCAFRSSGMRTPVKGVTPVRGRPGGLFGLSAIDLPLFLYNKNLPFRVTPAPAPTPANVLSGGA
jgi:hypothetical protein